MKNTEWRIIVGHLNPVTKKWTKVVLAMLLFVGCDAYEEHEALFGASNASFYSVKPIVANQEQDLILEPGEAMQFVVEIQVPTSTGPYEPSSDERTIIIPVSFRNMDTDELSREIMCEAGARVITHIRYEVLGEHPHLYENVSCTITR